MLKRTISGSVYVAILVGIFLLRQFVDYRIFHLLTWFFTVVGTYELVRALNGKTLPFTKWCALGFSVLFVPVYALGEYLVFEGWGWLFALDLIAVMVIATSVIAIIDGSDGKTFGITAFVYLYPALLLLTMLTANDLGENGFIALLMAFVVSTIRASTPFLPNSLSLL